MKIHHKLAALALLLATISSQPSTAFAQGSLTPPGAPAPTMKTLDQIEARTTITNISSPVMISQPGSYYLTHNLTVNGGSAITIATNGVTLDLNGFTITSTDFGLNSYNNDGILINSGLRNITIFNGFIQGGTTNMGDGHYSWGSFGTGIGNSGTAPVNTLVSHVSVTGCIYNGINLGSVVESCTVRTVGFSGINGSTVKQSSAMDCGSTAITGNQVCDCRGQCSGDGYGIYADTAKNCYGHSDGVNGVGVDAYSAQNCYGYGNLSGIEAFSAQNCYGYAGWGHGVSASVAQNCYGYGGGSAYGVGANIAVNCYGYSESGTGLYANIANSCSGTSLEATHNLNSY